MRRAALVCGLALAVGLAIGLVASSGKDVGAEVDLRPSGARLERVTTPAVGAIDVPPLKRAPTTQPVTPPPVSPVPPPPVAPPPVAPVPPPVAPPPPPPVIVVPG